MRPSRRQTPRKHAYRNVAAGVLPVAPRCGLNSKKEAAARGARRRVRRTSAVRKVFSLAKFLMIAGLVVTVLGGAGAVAWRAFENTGLLMLREVEVEGNRLWDRKAILEKAGLELGMKLPLVPVKKVEEALRSLPGVADVEVSRIYPSRLEIRLIEQAPVALGFAKGWKGLSPDGAAIPGLDLRDSDLPVVDNFASLGPARRGELGAFLESVRREHPSLFEGFSQVTVLGRPRSLREGGGAPADLEIVLRDGRLKVLVEMGNKSLASMEFLKALMRRREGALEPGRTVDLRVEGYAYVR
ncbi:MAG TPA: FtsQ-type POTRA domain-containing protein [Fibrobacteria bacterium]|nr:FtsQ-type POTRA domain-containing protein [Fibrobacteria bacterium]